MLTQWVNTATGFSKSIITGVLTIYPETYILWIVLPGTKFYGYYINTFCHICRVFGMILCGTKQMGS